MKPFLLGRKPNAEAPLRASHRHQPQRSEGAVKNGIGSPHVEVIKEGDKVVRLIVTCACGERTEIDCLYPAHG